MKDKETLSLEARSLVSASKREDESYADTVRTSPEAEQLNAIQKKINEMNARKTTAEEQLASLGRIGLMAPRALKQERRDVKREILDAKSGLPILSVEKELYLTLFQKSYGPSSYSTVAHKVEQAMNDGQAREFYSGNREDLYDMAREEARADGVELNLSQAASEQQYPAERQ